MENSNVNRLSFRASVMAKLSSLVILALQLYCGLIFYNGVVSGIGFANGVNFSEYAKELVNWFTGVIGGKADVLPGLFKVLHALILVVAVLNFLVSFIRFFGLFFGKKDKLLRNTKNSFAISKKFVGSVSWMVLFVVIASWVKSYSLNASAYLLMAVIGVGILVSCLERCVMNKAPFMTFVFQIVYCAIMFAIIGMICIFCWADVVTEVKAIVDSLKALGGASVKDMLPKAFAASAYVMIGLIGLSVVSMVRGCKKSVTVPNKKIRRASTSVAIFSMLYVVFEVLATKDFDKKTVEGYMVFLLVASAAFFFGLINPRLAKKNDDADEDADGELNPEDDENDNTEEAPAEEEPTEEAPVEEAPAEQPAALPEPAPAPMPEPVPPPAPAPKIVFVGKRVKKIKSKKYRNRTDINVIVIPESVAYIEGYAFFGCTELTEIHCERKEKPRFWHNQWNFGCPAKVVWDSTNAEADPIDSTEADA